VAEKPDYVKIICGN